MFFPLIRFKIMDKSMEPSFKEGDYVIANNLSYAFRKPKVGDVVIVRRDERFTIKRIGKIKDGKYFVCGDNKKYSSRLWVDKRNIVGKVNLRVKS